jgi:hypothetical protein
MYVILIVDTYNKAITSEKYYNSVTETVNEYQIHTGWMDASYLTKCNFICDRIGVDKYIVTIELDCIKNIKNKLTQSHIKPYIELFRIKYNRLNNIKCILY